MTGAISPDATGYYHQQGSFGGKPAYRGHGTGHWIWWEVGTTTWDITPAPGQVDPYRWFLFDPDPSGNYTPEGLCSGTPTVAVP